MSVWRAGTHFQLPDYRLSSFTVRQQLAVSRFIQYHPFCHLLSHPTDNYKGAGRLLPLDRSL